MVCEEGRHLLSANPETATVASRTSSREHSDNYLFLTGLAPHPPSQTKPLHGERSPFLSEKKKKTELNTEFPQTGQTASHSYRSCLFSALWVREVVGREVFQEQNPETVSGKHLCF